MIRVHSKRGKYIALLNESLTGGMRVVVTSDGVSAFNASWPCSRLRDRTTVFEFESNGDLVDIPWGKQPDGEELLALSQDAQAFGEKALERRLRQRADSK